MSQTPPASGPSVEGQMYLFRKAELITREKHGNMGISRPERPLAFVEKARAVPLTLGEMTTAMRHFPIIFSAADNPVPLAVTGLVDDENLFIDENGEWEKDVYVPGYIRRYPFALATDKDSQDPENPRMAIIVDGEYEGINDSPEIPFFNGSEPSEQMQQAMEFCQSYERDRIQTQRFADVLKGFDLLTQQMAQYTPDNKDSMAFARYIGVEEQRLRDLADDKYLELRKQNIIPVLYAQLMSMTNWRTLLDKRARRHSLTSANVLEPLNKS
ncbi:SapC family protein [Parvularcula sp. ZS-1/3]|uniref:SapC family protein n=1 Tax=Parvularcula mediterranea TaxID=2732508 RepID=A0A7Y3RJ52_9PROT|nr:SapC family protein [Parvularcula mediterranea]NNU15018.1 SapC family protein [Parvularcula mediterranea]